MILLGFQPLLSSVKVLYFLLKSDGVLRLENRLPKRHGGSHLSVSHRGARSPVAERKIFARGEYPSSKSFDKLEFVHFKPHSLYSSSMHGDLYSMYPSISFGNSSAAFSFIELYFITASGLIRRKSLNVI